MFCCCTRYMLGCNMLCHAHAIVADLTEPFQVVESRSRDAEVEDGGAVWVSTLTLVDLAGSERIAKTGAEGLRMKEGASINKSLLTLGTVINKLSEGAQAHGEPSMHLRVHNIPGRVTAHVCVGLLWQFWLPCTPDQFISIACAACVLSTGLQKATWTFRILPAGGHIPYRDSKLTRILQPSLGGNAKTAIICNITPAVVHVDESHSTLRFACRAKRVVNNAVVNEVLSDAAVLKRQAHEIEELRKMLQGSG